MTPETALARAVILQAWKDAQGQGMRALDGGATYAAVQSVWQADARRFLADLKQPGNIWREMIEADS